MRIEISTEFETSYSSNYKTTIVAKILNDRGVVLCEGQDKDSWPVADERRASAKVATQLALAEFERMLRNARDVAEKSGLA